jgi:hypothetical protein
MGSAKDTQTILRYTKPDTAQINYVQPVEDSVRSTVDKLAATLLLLRFSPQEDLAGVVS